MTEERNTKMKEVSEGIQELLESNSFALQPFLSFTEFGVLPRVRLVDVSEPATTEEDAVTTTEDGQDSNQTETGDSTEAEPATEPGESQDS